MKQRSRGRDYVASPPRQQPVNFGTVVANRVYRSGTPVMENCSYLTKTLGVRTVIYMCPGSYDAAMFKFLKDKNIAFVQYPIAGKTDPSVDPTGSVIGALKVIADERNHPVLIHCQGGKHRTGCVVGGLRKLQQWNIEKVLEEYEMYAGATPLENDVEFLRTFDVSGICTSLGPKIKAWKLRHRAKLIHAPTHVLRVCIVKIASYSREIKAKRSRTRMWIYANMTQFHHNREIKAKFMFLVNRLRFCFLFL